MTRIAILSGGGAVRAVGGFGQGGDESRRRVLGQPAGAVPPDGVVIARVIIGEPAQRFSDGSGFGKRLAATGRQLARHPRPRRDEYWLARRDRLSQDARTPRPVTRRIVKAKHHISPCQRPV